MKKIGILTFHDTFNYGASLQCYALQKKLNELGAKTEVVDYKCPWFNKRYSPFYIQEKTIKKLLYMLAALPMNIILKNKKNEFQKKFLPLSKEYTPKTISSANDEYDGFITGSDQVWNWDLTKFDKTYFLDFVREDKKKVSYAASIGLKEIEEGKKEFYKTQLSSYDLISVREESAANIVQDLTGNTPELVCDPVFLLKKEDWAKVAAPVEEKGYILLYSINRTKAYAYAQSLAKEQNKKIVYLAAPLKQQGVFIAKREEGPAEFVSWFRNADLVVTDSFHGTAFSLLFNKQFVSLIDSKNTRNSRIVDLLDKLDLSDRILENFEDTKKVLETIDYTVVGQKMDDYVNVSLQYLDKIIKL